VTIGTQGWHVVRTKTGVLDDPDVADPTVALTGVETWPITGRSAVTGGALDRVALVVSFRDADGVLYPGSFDAYAFDVMEPSASGGIPGGRPQVAVLGTLVGQSAGIGMLCTVSRLGRFGLRLSNIATDALVTQVIVSMCEFPS